MKQQTGDRVVQQICILDTSGFTYKSVRLSPLPMHVFFGGHSRTSVLHTAHNVVCRPSMYTVPVVVYSSRHNSSSMQETHATLSWHVQMQYLNTLWLQVSNDLGGPQHSSRTTHVKLHQLNHAPNFQIVSPTVKGEAFSNQSNLLLDRACNMTLRSKLSLGALGATKETDSPNVQIQSELDWSLSQWYRPCQADPE